MKYQTKSITFLLALATVPLLLTGCASNMGSNAPQTVSLNGIHGISMGGEQPIFGASILLYAAGTTGYASLNTNILTTSVKSGVGGAFTLTGDYTCTAGQQMYIISKGGNPGAGTNANQSTMAALGDCATLGPSTFININEVTTVAAAYALSSFATSYTNIGSDAAGATNLKHAFVNAAKLANTANGTTPGTLPAGATAPAQEIYALADILTTCVNSTGGTASDTSTSCGKLFSYTTPSGGPAPTDTFGAALNFAKYPTLNVAAILNRIPSPAPFATTFSSANDLTLSIVYTGGNFNAPSSAAIDTNGQIWVANSGNSTVSVLAQNGSPISGSPLSGNGLNSPAAIAIDVNGNAWVANKGASSLSAFTSTGGVYSASPFTPTGLNAPDALAFDASGNIWVANSGNNTVSELSSTGANLQQITAGVAAPSAIAINPK